MIIVSVQDVKSVFMGVHMDYNDQTAIRGFTQLLASSSDIGKFPADFRLWKLGDFDQETGLINVLDKPVLLYDGSSYVKKEGVNNG